MFEFHWLQPLWTVGKDYDQDGNELYQEDVKAAKKAAENTTEGPVM